MPDLWTTLRTHFLTEEYQPIDWHGSAPAFLLIHGFLGTPAEWRPIGLALRERGHRVLAPLLPGFGARLEELPRVRLEDWVAELRRAADKLDSFHSSIVVGFSLGGALALILAAQHQPSHLVLLAPFSRLPLPVWYRVLLPVLGRLHGGPRPFARTDFDDPVVQQALTGWNPFLDPHDPTIRNQLREVELPWRLLHQLARTASEARRVVKDVRCPVTIIHGIEDDTVPLRDTEDLLPRFHTRVRFERVVGNHQLVRPEHPSFSLVMQILTELGEAEKP